ncbi:hypothetical protein CWE15_11245 [Aliidiomarina taiwanensis]|uniref:Uncharacterized protein n=1 Tax=Aliidiomarina taiwanensis TaxID=946228 RepID=A0A432WVQ8_9GAMM|nr:hypothetical protein CWE15_11245 [Aliidiomarina taiwanensis]
MLFQGKRHPAEKLKITTVSDGMAHEVKVYNEDGNQEDRLQVGIQEFDKAVFTNFGVFQDS